jgi:hypothetical protein
MVAETESFSLCTKGEATDGFFKQREKGQSDFHVYRTFQPLQERPE